MISDDMFNTQASADDADVLFNSFLNYDLLDERGDTPMRLDVGELRSIAVGTADTYQLEQAPDITKRPLNTSLSDAINMVSYSPIPTVYII